MQSLNPTGFPPDSLRNCFTNFNNPFGDLKAVCAGGDAQSPPVFIFVS